MLAKHSVQIGQAMMVRDRKREIRGWVYSPRCDQDMLENDRASMFGVWLPAQPWSYRYRQVPNKSEEDGPSFAFNNKGVLPSAR